MGTKGDAHHSDTVTVFESGDGILLFGGEDVLAHLDRELGGLSRVVSSRSLARATGHAATAAGQLSAQSGRWVKLTKESATQLKRLKEHSIDKDGYISGVLRGKNKKFAHQLKIENLSKGALLTPAAPAVLGSIATQYALESALSDITAYLEVIDAKLDKLLKQRKIEALGQIGGVTMAIDEAYAIFEATGTVSGTTWSKIQSAPFALQSMQAEAVAQLATIAEDVEKATGDPDRTAKTLAAAEEDAQFWLGVLARTISLQDRQYILELEHLADQHPHQLDDHRQGITVARDKRLGMISQALNSVAGSVVTATRLSNAVRVVNPLSAPRVTRHAGAIAESIDAFAEHVDLQIGDGGDVSGMSWTHAARGLMGEASSAVGTAGSRAADRARATGQAIGAVGTRATDRARVAGQAVEERGSAAVRKMRALDFRRRARDED
ncbi:hypothetical protein [Ornithinimicrobium panacihumi]|uniref:hypothetical protein n=1 Tax=Ornithinimicrobium panacihumi TaxID=2008449 RepID=UPI003F8BDEF6